MSEPLTPEEEQEAVHDAEELASLGYAQELMRGMGGFSNFAISFSIICILAGGITSFALGFCSVGGAAIGIGWPVSCLMSILLAMTMGQIASAFPTAGGLYHWAAILGGKGWGWLTAWLNLLGLVTVLAAINVGCFQFALASLPPLLGWSVPAADSAQAYWLQAGGVAIFTLSQAILNHLGIRLTSRLTDLSGYLILAVSTTLTVSLLATAPHWDFSRLWTFKNYSGTLGGGVWPASTDLSYLFVLGILLPAYTITGFDASAHTAEETLDAAHNVPKGIVRSVLLSGLFGWILLCAIVLAMPDLDRAAASGARVVCFTMESVLSKPLLVTLYIGIVVCQYLCGLATVTSASRMVYAFARDGGLPASGWLRQVSDTYKSPANAIWTVAVLSMLFTLHASAYSTMTAVCVIYSYLSYILPVILGMLTYQRSWTHMGPWTIGRWFQPAALLCTAMVAVVFYASFQPPNDKALGYTAATLVIAAVAWFGLERHRFPGPPTGLSAGKQSS